MPTTVTGSRPGTTDQDETAGRLGAGPLGADRRAPQPPAMPPTQPGPDPVGGRPWHRITRSGWITAAIAAMTAVLYSWNLSSVGYGNSYYAAAVKSATVSWKAFFFGSLDPGSFITVDKPPVALWVQALSARLFGFNSWSMLLPEAAAGVASVLILHHLVRKWAGDVAAHLAAVALALTPVAVLMFRYNNPDAILTLLCLGAAWALWSAVETGRTRALIASALLIGLAFDTKMLQAFLVLPAFIGVYLLAGRPRLRVRIAQLAAAAGTLIVVAGWWIAVVALWPASSRPYIGSTTDNSIISLLTGYNGLSRLFGNSAGRGGAGAPGGAGGGGNTGFGGTSGIGRLFNTALGGQIAWLIPMAVAALLAGLWLTRHRARTDRSRAGWLLWGGWALVCAAVFSLSKGTFHPYYAVQLAPAVAALAGAGGVALWRLGRIHRSMVWALPAAIVVTAGWSVLLLERTRGYDSWLPPLIIAGGALGAAGLWAGSVLRQRTLVLVAAVVAGITLLAGPTAYAVTTVSQAQSGSIVAAGPGSSGLGGFGAGGGLGGGSTASVSGLVRYLEAHQGSATYLVATTGSQSSASIIIASGRPVITIGGFNGGDPAPTLAQFEKLVTTGQVRYVLVTGTGGAGGGIGGPGGGQGTSQAIDAWVVAHGTAVSSASLGGSTTAGTLYEVSAS